MWIWTTCMNSQTTTASKWNENVQFMQIKSYLHSEIPSISVCKIKTTTNILRERALIRLFISVFDKFDEKINRCIFCFFSSSFEYSSNLYIPFWNFSVKFTFEFCYLFSFGISNSINLTRIYFWHIFFFLRFSGFDFPTFFQEVNIDGKKCVHRPEILH